MSQTICLPTFSLWRGEPSSLKAAVITPQSLAPLFERLRAKLAGIASQSGMDKVFFLRGADIYRVNELRRVPGRRELPAAEPRPLVAMLPHRRPQPMLVLDGMT